MAATVSTPVEAQPPASASGTGLITELEITNVRVVGENRHEDRTIRGTIDGSLEGTFEQHTSGVVHKSGRVVFHGTMTFTGTVADCGEGTITLKVSGKGDVSQPGVPVTEASVRVVNQAANTVGITGQGTVSQVGPNLTYDVQYVCR